MRKIISIIVIIVLLILCLLAYLGTFSNVEVTEKETDSYTFVYKEHIGDYSKVGTVFDEIYNSLIADDIETINGFGIYYDNPDVIIEEELRSKVGSIITDEQAQKIDELGLNYKIMTADSVYAVVTELPYRNKLSVIVGVMKAYPAMAEYMEEKGYEIGNVGYELYDMENGKILYMLEIAN